MAVPLNIVAHKRSESFVGSISDIFIMSSRATIYIESTTKRSYEENMGSFAQLFIMRPEN